MQMTTRTEIDATNTTTTVQPKKKHKDRQMPNTLNHQKETQNIYKQMKDDNNDSNKHNDDKQSQ